MLRAGKLAEGETRGGERGVLRGTAGAMISVTKINKLKQVGEELRQVLEKFVDDFPAVLELWE